MQISNNLNSLMQLEKRLEESTEELAKLTRKEESGNQQKENNVKQDLKDDNPKEQPQQEKITEDIPVYNRDIALAYSVDHNVVSVQTTEHQSVLDIKA